MKAVVLTGYSNVIALPIALRLDLADARKAQRQTGKGVEGDAILTVQPKRAQ